MTYVPHRLWEEMYRTSALPHKVSQRYSDYYFDRLRWKAAKDVRDIDRRDRLFWTPHMQTDFFPALWWHWARMAACKERKRYLWLGSRKAGTRSSCSRTWGNA